MANFGARRTKGAGHYLRPTGSIRCSCRSPRPTAPPSSSRTSVSDGQRVAKEGGRATCSHANSPLTSREHSPSPTADTQ
eukprot:1968955-Rhodomonas_salina.2